MGLFPRAPESRTSTDFIVEVFVVTVALILIILTVAAVIAGLRGDNVSGVVNALTDVMTTIIGALIGFIAGKGQARNDRDKE